MPDTRTADIAILGAGTAGLRARREALDAGASVVLVDPGPLGTTCARSGCMPSKLLIAAADAAHDARHAERFGIAADVAVDDAAVLARLRRQRDRFVDSVRPATDEAAAAGELLCGSARVEGPGRLRVGEVEVRYGALVVATGSRPTVPPPYRALPPSRRLTSADLFELEHLPDSVLVVGLGPVGLELGQALHRLGARVVLLGLDHDLGPLSDPQVIAAARRPLGSELQLHPDHTLHQVEATAEGVRVTYTDADGHDHDEAFATVLVASGRRPQLDDLGLEALGVSTDDHGRWPIDPGTLQLGDQPVFVAGDANDLHPVLHEAVDDGRIAARNAIAWPELLTPRRRTPMSIVFTDPQLATVGRTYASLPPDAAIGSVDFTDQGRARVHGDHHGAARLYADRASRLVGAELAGPAAEHLAHLLAWAIDGGRRVDELLDRPFYHPTVEEGLRTALRQLAAELGGRPRSPDPVCEDGVGA